MNGVIWMIGERPQQLLDLAYSYVPHLIQLVDKNPYSHTYGCFDREYWHYRTLDFPCGMSQEFVLPLAQLFLNEFPENKYYGWERMRELAVAGINFTMSSSHKDGTCDDYFPFERAMGALVFSTYACTEAYQLLGLDDDRLVDFFRRRGDHLIKVNETGRLSNHQAFAALAAYNIYLVTGDDRYRRLSDDRAELTLSWQHPEEGWFQEYDGSDPGYHSCTIAFLGKLFQKNGNEALVAPLCKAIDFAWHFSHPDGSYAGEYGSRNTYHFYPHGFEVMSPHSKKAGQIVDQFIKGLATDKRYHNDDDRMCCHNVYDWIQTWQDYHPERPEPRDYTTPSTIWMSGAGMAVVQRPGYYAVSNMKKGGVTKVYNESHCVASDTGLIGELEDGRVVVSHLMDEQHSVEADPDESSFSVEGWFSVRHSKLSSPLKIIIFRFINLTAGRFFPNLLRSLIQKLLITGKNRIKFRFSRTIRFTDEDVHISDALLSPDIPLKRLSRGVDATSIYVANSNVYQESTIRSPWEHANEEALDTLRDGGVWGKRLNP